MAVPGTDRGSLDRFQHAANFAGDKVGIVARDLEREQTLGTCQACVGYAKRERYFLGETMELEEFCIPSRGEMKLNGTRGQSPTPDARGGAMESKNHFDFIGLQVQ
jgi:hypothetical protein